MSSTDDDDSGGDTGAGDAFNIFFWGTFAFFILKYNLCKADGTRDWIWALGYLLGMCILMYMVNMNIMSSKCGSGNTDTGVLLKATLLPWVLIFAVVVAILLMAPGWKAPFSNTIGFLVVKMSGGKEAFRAILKPEKGCGSGGGGDEAEDHADTTDAGSAPADEESAPPEKAASPGGHIGYVGGGGGGYTYRRKSRKVMRGGATPADICMIYNDPTPLMNQLTVGNFAESLMKLTNIMKPRYAALLNGDDIEDLLNNHVFKRLQKLVYLKDMIAEWVWYILTGSVVLVTSDNIITNSKCAKSKDAHSDYHDEAMAQADELEESLDLGTYAQS